MQLYRARIEGMAHSWARMATRGTRLHGMIWDGAELYVVEPSTDVADALVAPARDDIAGTVIFRLKDVLIDSEAASCSVDASTSVRRADETFASLLDELKHSASAMQAAGASRQLSVSVLGDSPFQRQYPDAQSARDAIAMRFNNVDGIYN